MSGFRRYPLVIQALLLGLAAVTVSGLSSCDSTPNSITRSPDAGSSASPSRNIPRPPNLTGPNTALDPLSQPTQLPVPSSGAQPPSNSKALPLPNSGAAASRNPLLPGGIPAGTPELPTGGAELPSTQPSSGVAQELARARAALAQQTQLPPQLSPPTASSQAPATALPAPAPRPPASAVPSGAGAPAPLRDTSGLTEEAKALSQPVSRNAPPPAPLPAASTSLPSITSNSLPSMDFESSGSAASGPNRSRGSNTGNRSARSANPSGLRTAEYVYNPATGSYGPGN
ncbi:hypothetical protein [Acaryochloris thomasi]|nr:hypothetical protein [Acaryochloris thomasi]